LDRVVDHVALGSFMVKRSGESFSNDLKHTQPSRTSPCAAHSNCRNEHRDNIGLMISSVGGAYDQQIERDPCRA